MQREKRISRLEGKTAIVTGAGSGIGRATALRLASEEARVALWDKNEQGITETLSSISAAGSRGFTVVVDVSQSAEVQRAVQQSADALGQIDILFNGAGISGRRFGDGPVDQCSEEGWDTVLSINLTSMFLVCKYVLPWMLRREQGSIINLSSVLGMGGDPDFATHAYAASKAGIIGMSRAMAVYYAPKHIRVNVIAPSLIATAMSQRAQSDEHILSRLPELQPLTGAMGHPDDVAAAVAYLASDDAQFVTGIVLPVDGGWTAH